MQEVLHLDHLHDRGQQAGKGEDLDECDEGRRDEDAEIQRERGRRYLAREERRVGVERDGRKEQRERHDEHDHQQHERVRGLLVGETRGECQRADAQASTERDKAEVTRRRLNGAVAMHLKSE